VIGLIVLLFIPIFCEQNRLSALFNCRKKRIDNNDQIKNQDENNRNLSPTQLSVLRF